MIHKIRNQDERFICLKLIMVNQVFIWMYEGIYSDSILNVYIWQDQTSDR